MLRHPALKLLLGLVLIGGVGYALWIGLTDPRMSQVEWHLQPLPIAVGFLLMLGSSTATALLWLTIFRGLGGRIGTAEGVRIFLVTNIGKYLPGKVMHAAGRVALLQGHNQSASIGVTSVLVELALSLLGAALLSAISIPILLQGQVLTVNLDWLSWLSYLALPAGLIGLHPKVMGPLLRFLSNRLPGKATELCTDLPPYRTILLLLVAYVASWVMMSVALFATSHTVVGALGWEHLPAVSGIAALSYLFGLAVPIAPAGLGAREGLMTLLLSTMMPAPAAAVTSVLYRIVTISAEMLAAGLSILAARAR
ncbi:MAG: lysylphosphatidylglycerol synthase domain-containing protein [Chloroflexota bacterium]